MQLLVAPFDVVNEFHLIILLEKKKVIRMDKIKDIFKTKINK
jgi:hypothetical protein